MSTKKLSGKHDGKANKRRVGTLLGSAGSERILYRCYRCRGPVSGFQGIPDGNYMSHPRCVKRSAA